MKEGINNHFPRDPDTINIIKEIEAYLKIPHRNIILMKNCDIDEYINKIILLLIQIES